MRELIQAANFYDALDETERRDLAEAVAADIIFLDDDMQLKIIKMMEDVDRRLAADIAERNSFTI